MVTPMRRWFAILLLVLLPLQAIWAAAAPYCEHEQAPAAAKHLGHHEHEHQDVDVGPDESPGKPGATHADCHVCHGSASAPIAGGACGSPPLRAKHLSISEATALTAPPLTRPERPKWQHLA